MIFNSEYLIEKLKHKHGDLEVTSEDELLRLMSSGKIPDKDLISAFTDIRLKLGEHMKLDAVLFLFGNGASIYAGSKDTHDFCLANYTQKAQYREIGDTLEKIKTLGIEEQLNALITIQTFYNITGDQLENSVSSLIDEIKKDLICEFVNSVDYQKLSLHNMFLLKLRAFSCLPRTQIFTPNYDLAFEYTLDQLSIEYCDGFSGFVNRQFDSRTLSGNGRTKLIKIHGSVNWVLDAEKIKELQPRFSNGKVEIADTQPILIYPTSGKLYQTYATPYSELMRHMLNKMETGKNVITVLGYRYGDEHINEILYKALENPNNIFYFFGYGSIENCTFLANIRELTESMPNVNLIFGKVLASFDTFVKYILPATLEKTDEEKALEMLQKVLVKHE